MAMMPGGEEFYLKGEGEKGCLLIHGFTGTPSHMRPMGEALNQEGITVLGVRLPGHGTTLVDLHPCQYRQWVTSCQRALMTLKEKCQQIYVAGLSMGGTLALYLAKEDPELRGVIPICNPLLLKGLKIRLIPVIKYFKKSWKKGERGIKNPQIVENAYQELSLPAAHELLKLCKKVKEDLSLIKQRALVIAAREDGTVPLENQLYMMKHLGSSKKELFILENSYHVATLDYDAPLLFRKTISFMKEEQ